MIILLPPSEGKFSGGNTMLSNLSFTYQLPDTITISATERDLKCTGTRYQQAKELNKNIYSSPTMPAIERYTGVMYKAIDYPSMSSSERIFFEENVLICSGLYGLVRPTDTIADYKLPITTKGLYKFWGNNLLDTLNKLDDNIIIDLLPLAHKKLFKRNLLKSNASVIHVDFYETKNNIRKKMTHTVKKVKGEWIRKICEEQGKNIIHTGKREITLEIDSIPLP